MQSLLRMFVRAQMTFHARSLEILTEADEHIGTMSVERDIQVPSNPYSIHLTSTTHDSPPQLSALSAP